MFLIQKPAAPKCKKKALSIVALSLCDPVSEEAPWLEGILLVLGVARQGRGLWIESL
jgi:hypothetical protein